jgi:hypothetical protein
VLWRHGLTKEQISKTARANTVKRGAVGAAETGGKAAGGIALARLVPRIGRVAPFAAAAALVEAGKEYIDFRRQVVRREKDRGGTKLSEREERLLRKLMRLRIGRHIVANAGSGAGAALVPAAAATLAGGALGTAAYTGCALTAGLVAYFLSYAGYNRAMANVQDKAVEAKENAEQLWYGAKILFEGVGDGLTHGPKSSDESHGNNTEIVAISIDDCASLIARLIAVNTIEAGSPNEADFIEGFAVATQLSNQTKARVQAIAAGDGEQPARAISCNDGPVVGWPEFWGWVEARARNQPSSVQDIAGATSASQAGLADAGNSRMAALESKKEAYNLNQVISRLRDTTKEGQYQGIVLSDCPRGVASVQEVQVMCSFFLSNKGIQNLLATMYGIRMPSSTPRAILHAQALRAASERERALADACG